MTDWTRKRHDSASKFARDEHFLRDPWMPQSVSDVLMAFPGDIGHLIPDPMAIPDEFWESSGNDWVEFIGRWFASGLTADTRAFLAQDIDGNTAFRHLKTVLGSYQPKHEHKSAGLAFLCSRWFHGVEVGGKVYGHIPEGHEEQK